MRGPLLVVWGFEWLSEEVIFVLSLAEDVVFALHCLVLADFVAFDSEDFEPFLFLVGSAVVLNEEFEAFEGVETVEGVCDLLVDELFAGREEGEEARPLEFGYFSADILFEAICYFM